MMQQTQSGNSSSSTDFTSVESVCELDDDLPFCFGCEELFPDRIWLEEHPCPAMKYICSCGTEFSLYMDMLRHSTEHEPGHSTMHHATIKRRRMEMQKKKEGLLNRFKPVHLNLGPVSTVDLWPLYQPVVLLKTVRCFDKERPFQCANCELGFTSKNSLIRHHTVHNKKRVIACVLCGGLLPFSKSIPVPHLCSKPSSSTSIDSITAASEATITAAPEVCSTAVPSELNDMFERKMGGYQDSPIVSHKVEQAHTLSKHQVCENTYNGTHGKEGFRCRVCQLPFHSNQMLHRHKCDKAADYVQRLALMPTNRRRVTHVTSLHTLPQNNVDGELRVNIQASTSIQMYHKKALGPESVTDVDFDDDCYVIESSSPTQLLKMKITSAHSQ